MEVLSLPTAALSDDSAVLSPFFSFFSAAILALRLDDLDERGMSIIDIILNYAYGIMQRIKDTRCILSSLIIYRLSIISTGLACRALLCRQNIITCLGSGGLIRLIHFIVWVCEYVVIPPYK